MRTKIVLLALLFLVGLPLKAGANASFLSSLNVTLDLSIPVANQTLVVAGPILDPIVDIKEGAASTVIEPMVGNVQISPTSIEFLGTVGGQASQPGGHAAARTGGLSYEIAITNRSATAIANLDLTGTVRFFLQATADPGDIADASFGFSVLTPPTFAGGFGRGEGLFAPPSDLMSETMDFTFGTGPIGVGQTVDIVIRAFVAGSATAVSEPSTVGLIAVGLVALGFAGRRASSRNGA